MLSFKYFRFMSTACNQYILAVNSGSSSLKFSLYQEDNLLMALYGSVKPNSAGEQHFIIQDHRNEFWANHPLARSGVLPGIKELIGWLHGQRTRYPISAIAHRLVQGGPNHREPEIITPELLKQMHELTYLAPNHIPIELDVIKTFQAGFPDAVQVACFDTHFHKNMPDCAKYYALPADYRERGLIRYGFHGLSYEYVMEKLVKKSPGVLKKKVIIAHLGNGASMVAVKNGRSIDTTMGLSPMGGLVMGTRSGDLDPGVLLFLLNKGELSVKELDNLLSRESGLKAIAGYSDMETLVLNEARDEKAEEAITTFCYQIKKSIGALAAAMGGLDTLVFTGGIGENSAVIRKYICQDMEFLGIRINQRLNYEGHHIISKAGGTVTVRVMATDEAAIMARHTQAIISKSYIS